MGFAGFPNTYYQHVLESEHVESLICQSRTELGEKQCSITVKEYSGLTLMESYKQGRT